MTKCTIEKKFRLITKFALGYIQLFMHFWNLKYDLILDHNRICYAKMRSTLYRAFQDTGLYSEENTIACIPWLCELKRISVVHGYKIGNINQVQKMSYSASGFPLVKGRWRNVPIKPLRPLSEVFG